MSRAFLVVMDSVGIGGAPDAGAFFNGAVPDTGANTLGHIAGWRAGQGGAAPLSPPGYLGKDEGVGWLPNLDRLGLGAALGLASGEGAPGLGAVPEGAWGAATEVSRGKDTPSGHWELCGVPVPWDWTLFPDRRPAFPEDLVTEVCRIAGTGGILGNCHASGTAILDALGAEHLRTLWPICYTSADSVFQIAAHEEAFGLDRLLSLCEGLAPRLHAMRVGRVIARPFRGSAEAGFVRTGNRRDYALPPPAPTLLDAAKAAGREVHAVGKIGDIFAHRGITDLRKGDDRALMGHLSDLVETAPEGALVVANFVEFDSLYGHRRDPAGYAAHLDWFDAAIGALLPRLRAGDLMVLTADHGNDPTWSGTDHTRERVPVLCAGIGARALGHLAFADVGASIAAHLGIGPVGPGRSFL